MVIDLITSAQREDYLKKICGAIEKAEKFVLVTAFATADGITLLEPGG